MSRALREGILSCDDKIDEKVAQVKAWCHADRNDLVSELKTFTEAKFEQAKHLTIEFNERGLERERLSDAATRDLLADFGPVITNSITNDFGKLISPLITQALLDYDTVIKKRFTNIKEDCNKLFVKRAITSSVEADCGRQGVALSHPVPDGLPSTSPPPSCGASSRWTINEFFWFVTGLHGARLQHEHAQAMGRPAADHRRHARPCPLMMICDDHRLLQLPGGDVVQLPVLEIDTPEPAPAAPPESSGHHGDSEDSDSDDDSISIGALSDLCHGMANHFRGTIDDEGDSLPDADLAADIPDDPTFDDTHRFSFDVPKHDPGSFPSSRPTCTTPTMSEFPAASLVSVCVCF